MKDLGTSGKSLLRILSLPPPPPSGISHGGLCAWDWCVEANHCIPHGYRLVHHMLCMGHFCLSVIWSDVSIYSLISFPQSRIKLAVQGALGFEETSQLDQNSLQQPSGKKL